MEHLTDIPRRSLTADLPKFVASCGLKFATSFRLFSGNEFMTQKPNPQYIYIRAKSRSYIRRTG